MPRDAPRVSVVIPVYNSVATLERAVTSVLGQTLRSIELLIVDDGSRDRSLELARHLAATDSRIHVISLPENRGKACAMNRAIAEASGFWIAVLDADDWYEPERLAVLVEAAERHGLPMVADNQRFHDAGANTEVGTAFPADSFDRVLTRRTFDTGSDPYAEFNYGMLKPIISADFIQATGLAYRENVRLSEDFLYLVEFFAAGGTGILLTHPLYNWTQAFGRLSRQWTTTGAGSWRYDFQSALAGHAEVLHSLRDRRDHLLADLLVAHARACRRLHHLNAIKRARASGATLPQVLSAIARHPSIWPQIARRALRASRRYRASPDRTSAV
jgi:glycosyltransferase involved in cell wall biosynthesis